MNGLKAPCCPSCALLAAGLQPLGECVGATGELSSHMLLIVCPQYLIFVFARSCSRYVRAKYHWDCFCLAVICTCIRACFFA